MIYCIQYKFHSLPTPRPVCHMRQYRSTIGVLAAVLFGIIMFSLPAISANLAIRVWKWNSLEKFANLMEWVAIIATVALILVFIKHLRGVDRDNKPPRK